MVQRKKVQWSKVALSCDVTISSSSPQKTIIPFSKEIKNHHFLKHLIFSSRLFKPGKNRDICFFFKKMFIKSIISLISIKIQCLSVFSALKSYKGIPYSGKKMQWYFPNKKGLKKGLLSGLFLLVFSSSVLHKRCEGKNFVFLTRFSRFKQMIFQISGP